MNTWRIAKGWSGFAATVLMFVPAVDSAAKDLPEVVTREVYSAPCLVEAVDEYLTKTMKEDVERASKPYGMFSAVESPTVCVKHGTTVVAASPPKLIGAFWQSEKAGGKQTNCPPPFASATLHGPDASFGCRTDAGPGNVCALRAYQGDTQIVSIASGDDPLADRSYVEFAKFYIVHHLPEFPKAKSCVQRFYKLGPKG